jgi:hypothetical protein
VSLVNIEKVAKELGKSLLKLLGRGFNTRQVGVVTLGLLPASFFPVIRA